MRCGAGWVALDSGARVNTPKQAPGCNRPQHHGRERGGGRLLALPGESENVPEDGLACSRGPNNNSDSGWCPEGPDTAGEATGCGGRGALATVRKKVVVLLELYCWRPGGPGCSFSVFSSLQSMT